MIVQAIESSMRPIAPMTTLKIAKAVEFALNAASGLMSCLPTKDHASAKRALNASTT